MSLSLHLNLFCNEHHNYQLTASICLQDVRQDKVRWGGKQLKKVEPQAPLRVLQRISCKLIPSTKAAISGLQAVSKCFQDHNIIPGEKTMNARTNKSQKIATCRARNVFKIANLPGGWIRKISPEIWAVGIFIIVMMMTMMMMLMMLMMTMARRMMTLAANTIRRDGDPGRVFNAAPATTWAAIPPVW